MLYPPSPQRRPLTSEFQQLRVTLPVSIFIPPNIPLDDKGNLVSQRGGLDEKKAVPPSYGRHVLDPLCDNVIFSASQTRESSVLVSASTPRLYSISRFPTLARPWWQYWCHGYNA